MPIVKPKKFERKKKFIWRFTKSKRVVKEFPNTKQRIAVAFWRWKRK